MGNHEKIMLALTIVAALASVSSMVFTASIAMKCNGKLTQKIERWLGIDIAEK